MAAPFTPTLADVIEGTYSKSRYSGKLDDVVIHMTGEAIRHGVPGSPTECAIAIRAHHQAATGSGFPSGIDNILILGVTAAEKGVSTYPELHFAATLRGTGKWVLCKAICSIETLGRGIEIVSCNDLSRTEEIACKYDAAGQKGETFLIFTDVRYTEARMGSDMPVGKEEAYVRELLNNAVRKARNAEESVANIRAMAPAYAARHEIDPQRAEQLTALAVAQAPKRAPGARDRTGEPVKRKPVRLPKSRAASQPQPDLERPRSTAKRWIGGS